jgi:sec-independent protein translocase protein TatC
MPAKKIDDKRMELTEHLAELRIRIMRAVGFLLAAAFIAYNFFTPIYGLLYRPLVAQMKTTNQKVLEQPGEPTRGLDPRHLPPSHNPPTEQDIVNLQHAVLWLQMHPTQPSVMGNVFHGFYEMFTVRIKLSLIFGLIMATPLILWEAAMFVLPALTPEEREPLRIMLPTSILLLMFGVLVAYLTMYYAMGWFLSYLPDFPNGATLMQDPNDYVIFFVKMMAAFGIAFQLPVVLMGLAHLGLITSKGMIKNWRWGFVLAVLGGVFTPSNDVISMALMAFPLLFLYFFSILLVRMVERKKLRVSPS